MATAEENASFTCPVDPFCLGMCSWTDCPGNADVAIREPHSHHQSTTTSAAEVLTSTTAANELHPTGSGHFTLE